MTSKSLYLSLPALLLTQTVLVVALLARFCGAELLEFTGVFAAIMLVPVIARGGSASVDVFRPFLGLGVLLYLYSISTLLFVLNVGVSYYGESVSPDDLATYKMACLLAAAGISFGALLAQGVSIATVRRSDGDWARKRDALIGLAGACAVLFLPFVADKFSPWNATAYGDVALSLRIDRLADTSAGIKEILLETIPVTFILCGCLVLMFDSRRALTLRIAAGTVFGLYCATMLLSGWRGHLMSAALMAGIYFHYRVRRIGWFQVMTAGLAIYVLINVLSVVRASSAPMEMLSLLIDTVADRGLGFLAVSQSGELATSTNLIRLIAGIRLGETDFGLGSITLGQIAAFLPRPLMPGRPPLASELFVMTFYPGVLESGGGYGFFMVQDGYWDFGLIGAFTYCLIFGFLLEVLYRWMRPRMNSDLVVFVYALAYGQLVLAVVRSGIFASIKAALIAAIPIAVMAVLVGLLTRVARAGEMDQMGTGR